MSVFFFPYPEQRLAKASPQAVRRIKNNLGSNERVSNGRLEVKRNSFNEGSMSLQPKQPNWTSQLKSPTRRVSDEYSLSSVGVANSRPLSYQPQQDRRQKMKRTHVYEDVESPEPQPPPMIHVSADSHARTRSWVESHNERMWANEDIERSDSAEGHRRGDGHRHGDIAVGSLWASRNRPEGSGGHHHQIRGAHPSSSSSSKERRNQPRMSRLGGRGHAFAPPPMTVESDFLGSSYSRAASLPTSHLSASLAGSSSRRLPGTTSGHKGLGSKKTSYSIAVGVSPVDIPDKDTPLHHGGRGRREVEQQTRGERFSSSEHFTSSTTGRMRSRSREGGEQSWQGMATDAPGGYVSSSRSSHALHQGGHGHHAGGMYPRQFNSLQRQLSPPQQIQAQPPQHHYASSSSRRSSESSRDSYGGGYILQDNQDHYSHYGRDASRGGGRILPQRTYSNDAPHGQRVEGMGPSPIPNRESYL